MKNNASPVSHRDKGSVFIFKRTATFLILISKLRIEISISDQLFIPKYSSAPRTVFHICSSLYGLRYPSSGRSA